MGLDLVEFVMSVEESFELTIPDRELQELVTPGRLIDYLTNRLPAGPAPQCLSQRAFYKLRAIICRRLHLGRGTLRPDTDLLEIFPDLARDELWKDVAHDLGAGKFWPRLAKPGWFVSFRSPRLNRLRDIARFLVAYNPGLFLRTNEGWTRCQVAEVVRTLMRENLGILPNKYTENTSWSEMGVA